MSKEVSKEEAKKLFLSQVRNICAYWSSDQICGDVKDRCEGVAFSIMNIFDGACGGFPCAVDLVLRPHPDDKKYNIENNEDYIVDGMVINDGCHLHSDLINE